MKAMVFAAGLGTRLKPFTDFHPKALAEVGGQPMLGRVIEKIKALGVDHIVVNVHHFADQVVDYLRSCNNFGLQIDISDESSRLLDTGGGLLAAAPLLAGDEDIIVHNADILTDFDLADMVRVHTASRAMATLLADWRQTKRYLLFDRSTMQMRGWTNIETSAVRPQSLVLTDALEKLAFGGVHIVSPRIFTLLKDYAAAKFAGDDRPKFSITDFYIDACADADIRAYRPSASYRWHDIGKPESLAAARSEFPV